METLRTLWQIISPYLASALPFFMVLCFKFLLDLNLAHVVVKWFWWVPIRSFLRQKPYDISGRWRHIWESGGSDQYAPQIQRVGHTNARQLGYWWYAEFGSGTETYIFFGEIRGDYLIGKWYDANSGLGYYGAFELWIKDDKNMEGLWVGHSKSLRIIRSDITKWDRGPA